MNLKYLICTVCPNKHYANGYCSKHNSQLRRHGKIFQSTSRDPQVYVSKGNTTEIILKNSDVRIKIDTTYVSLIKNFKWSLDKDGYACAKINKTTKRIHRLILGANKEEEVDHINRNKLDNRRANLRIVSHHVNVLNRKQTGDGVSFRPERNKWRARVKWKGKEKTIGHFISEKEAVNFRKRYLLTHPLE